MFGWFKKIENKGTPLTTDIHSHLLPGLDDGVKSLEEAEEILRHFSQLGYKKVITTPHVMGDHYRNTNEHILKKLHNLRTHLLDKNINITVEAAAEYYLDEYLLELINTGTPLLTFGDQYLLFETNFLSEPFHLKEFIFMVITKGFKPVLAHPERYIYLNNDWNKIADLVNRGVLFQINIASLAGHYSRGIQLMAERLVEKGHVHFLGSDCHHLQHAHLINQANRSKYFQKALTLPLINNTL